MAVMPRRRRKSKPTMTVPDRNYRRFNISKMTKKLSGHPDAKRDKRIRFRSIRDKIRCERYLKEELRLIHEQLRDLYRKTGSV